MKKIIVDNFEMIDHEELTLDKNLNIIIGPQASGKSTLVKLIFFCRKLRDYLLDYLARHQGYVYRYRSLDDSGKQWVRVRMRPSLENCIRYLTQKFEDCFGTIQFENNFKVCFYFDVERNHYVTLTPDNKGYLEITFEDNMKSGISKCLKEARNAYGDLDDFSQYLKAGNSARDYFKPILDDLFQDGDELIYIPAGRSVLSLFSGARQRRRETVSGVIVNNELGVDISEMDTLFQDFVNLVQGIKPRFNMSLQEMIPNYQKTSSEGSNARDAKKAVPIINSILHAEYRRDADGEKLYYNEREYVRLKFASSGQQEVLWILNLIFLKILENKRVFLVLEEPEAHLFPVAQKGVVDLIALLIHATNSSVFITTHSPYILTSVNLCVYSAQVENNPKLPKQPSDVIPKYLRVPPEKYDAFMTPERNQRSEQELFLERIKDEESGFIDASKIDEISDRLTEETDRLIDLEVQYDL